MKKPHVRQVQPLEIIYFGQYKINLGDDDDDDDGDDGDDNDNDDGTVRIQIFRFLEKTYVVSNVNLEIFVRIYFRK